MLKNVLTKWKPLEETIRLNLNYSRFFAENNKNKPYS
jgi:hypothetical protein